MKLPHPSRLSQQLTLAFGVVLMLLVALLVTALATQHAIVSRMQQTIDGDSAKADQVAELVQHVYASALSMRNLSVINNPSELGDEYTRLLTHIKAYDEAVTGFSRLQENVGSTTEEQTQLAKVHDAAAAAREIMALAKASATGTAPDDYAIGIRTELRRDLTRWNAALAQWTGAINTLRQLEVQQVKRGAVTINHEVSTSRIALVCMAAVALVVGMFAAWLVARAIGKPIASAVVSANHMASGDLSQSIEVMGSGEVAQLLIALKNMQSNLLGIVSNVRSSSESVAAASSEIAQGNQDLSNRTEQQASALEQTTASMEDLNARVRQNADSAQQATHLAASASKMAIQGGDAVSHIVETMRDINASSRKIFDIISVMDGIAFQTNILALNAAVEASSAGEQGRGFAVVATEVRSLASRSAEAAKEIKRLISTSAQQVSQGNALVEKTRDTMIEVVTSIQHVTEIVQKISAACNEQSTGASQIGQAIQQMDHVTQQNAALVEEIAATAAGLKLLADEQVKSVSVFQLHAPLHLPA